MSLETAKPILIESLEKVFEAEASATESPEQSRRRIAEKIADAIEVFIKSAELQVDAGISVTTSSGSGATTSIGTGKII